MGHETNRGAPVDVIGLGSKTPAKPQLGDVDCDGEITSLDANIVLQLAAGLIQSLPCQEVADFNHDGSIDPLDALLILQTVAGKRWAIAVHRATLAE